MCNEYAYQVAKALIYPELTVEFAADVINGNIYGSQIWDEVCTLTGGWRNDTTVFLAWDKTGRPDEWDYLVANARISAMAETVADTLYTVVNETVVNDGWECIPATEIETDMHGIGWLEEGCDALGVYTESYLIKPNGK